MFHASAWGYPFQAVTRGAKISYPGSDLSPDSLLKLVAEEQVTFAAGAPTVWIGAQQSLIAKPDRDTSSIRAVFCGGSARHDRAVLERGGIRVFQGWGMTETNPVASVTTLKPHMEDWNLERQLDILEAQGLPIAGLQVKIIDGEGEELSHDGEAFGELLIRGPWVAAEYLRDDRTPQSFLGGWLRTGDICKITPDGYVKITDRSKDVIKSGGEWISSLDLENALMAHPGVAEAAVVGLRHMKWLERPAAFVVRAAGSEVDEDDLIEFLSDKVAKWWLPDEVVFIAEIPKTGTGKSTRR